MFDSQFPLFCHRRISQPAFCKLWNIIRRPIYWLKRWKPLIKCLKPIKMYVDGLVILFIFRINSYVMAFVFFTRYSLNPVFSEWLLFSANSAISSYIMAKTSYFSMRWWWSLLCARPTRLVGFLQYYLTDVYVLIIRWEEIKDVSFKDKTIGF